MTHEWTKEEFTKYIIKEQAKRRARKKGEADAYEISKHLDLQLGKRRKTRPKKT